MRYLLYGFTVVMLFVSNTNAASEVPEIQARGQAELFLFLGLLLACVVVWNIPKKPRKVRSPELQKNGPEQIEAKKKEVGPERFPAIESAALRLREVATKFDDPRFDVFFNMENLTVARSTNSRTSEGPGRLVVARSRFQIDYINLRSKNREPKKIIKKWADVQWLSPDQFQIYTKEAVLNFSPKSVEDHLVFSAFWQLFSEDFMPSKAQFEVSGNSNLGEKLRAVAEYIDKNRKAISQSKGALDVRKIKFDLAAKKKITTQNLAIPEVGAKIEGFILTKELGEGGFGKVFEAQKVDDKTVKMAFKFMKIPKAVLEQLGEVKPGSPAYHELADEFISEAKTSLNFANRAYVMNAEHYGMEPWPWIAFPLAGSSVQSLIDSGKVTEGMWWDLAHDLLSGLMSIHDEGIIHLDIKPDNIMRMDDRYMILDLGLAHTKGYEFKLGGSPGFQAPEVVEMSSTRNFNSPVPFEADIYSAGVTLLWAALPANFREILRGIDSIELLSLLEKVKISQEAKILIQRMMNQNPKKRGSASELLFSIKDYIDIDEKIKQIEMASRRYDRDAAENLEGGEHAKLDKKIKGPFNTWGFIEKELKVLLQDVKPAFFSYSLKISGPMKRLYFQALYIGGGWVLECESDQFENVKFNQRNVKKLLDLGWSAPTDSSPNFEKMLDGTDPKAMAVQFTTALEQGYGISSSSIESVRITAQNKNAY